MFKRMGRRGVKGVLNNVHKTAGLVKRYIPYQSNTWVLPEYWGYYPSITLVLRYTGTLQQEHELYGPLKGQFFYYLSFTAFWLWSAPLTNLIFSDSSPCWKLPRSSRDQTNFCVSANSENPNNFLCQVFFVFLHTLFLHIVCLYFCISCCCKTDQNETSAQTKSLLIIWV